MYRSPSIPIWQAPTGSVAGPELCAAVTAAGGMGAMGLTWTAPDDARRKVMWVRERSAGLFQANFALHFEPKSLPAALEAGLPVVTFSWGMPGSEVALAHSFGASVGVQVASREGAKRALDGGADFLVCQGVEAGGHVQAHRSLWVTLPEVVEEAGALPVVASGGIGGAASIVRALDAGATGAMLGTRFVATQESLAHPIYKRSIVEGETAELTVCFDRGWPGAPHRVLRNRTLGDWEAAGCPPVGSRPGEDDIVAYSNGDAIRRYEDTAPRVGMEGRIEEMCLYAGLSCAEVHDLPKAGDVVVNLWAEVSRMRERSQD